MKVYYARPVSLYNTPQDERDLNLLTQLGLEVVNPNKEELEKRYKIEGMDTYLKIVSDCDMVAFRANPDMKITAGVFKEVQRAIEEGKPVIELPNLMSARILSVDDTREYLKLIGNR